MLNLPLFLLCSGVRCCVEKLSFNEFRAPSGFLRWRVLVPRSTSVPSIALSCCVCPVKVHICIILLRAPDSSPLFRTNKNPWVSFSTHPNSWTSAWQKELGDWMCEKSTLYMGEARRQFRLGRNLDCDFSIICWFNIPIFQSYCASSVRVLYLYNFASGTSFFRSLLQ